MLSTMRCYPNNEDSSDEAFALAATLPPDDGVAVLLHTLIANLQRMEPSGALRMREEITQRFGGRYCRGDTCAMMTELIDAHLAAAGMKDRSPIAKAEARSLAAQGETVGR